MLTLLFQDDEGVAQSTAPPTTPTGGSGSSGIGGAVAITFSDAPTEATIQGNIDALLPQGWFGSPIKDALVAGLANAHAFIYDLIAYLRKQTRIGTATDGFLDLIAADFFGTTLIRKGGQSDPSFQANILASLVRERVTRNAVITILTQLTGVAPLVFEPQRAADAGGYRTAALCYGAAGGYGSMRYPYQSFVTAYRPIASGIPNVGGYGSTVGGYSTPSSIKYVSLDDVQSGLTDDDITFAVNSVRPIAYTIWLRIMNAPPRSAAVRLLTESGLVIDTESGSPIDLG